MTDDHHREEHPLRSPEQPRDIGSGPSPRQDISRVLGILLRRAWIAIIFMVVVITMGAYLTWRQEPVYQARATIIIDARSPQILSDIREVVDLGTGNYWSNQEYYETQYKVISSRRIASLVADEQNLHHDLDFLNLRHITDQQELAEALSRRDPVDILLGRVQVTPEKGSRVVSIAIRDTDPHRARRLANAWAEAYIKSNLDEGTLTTIDASQTLAQQFEDLRRKLESSEKALYDFKQEHQILTGSLEDMQNITSRKLMEFTQALNQIETERIRLRARLSSLERLLETPDASRVLDPLLENPVLKQLRQSMAELTTQRAELLARYLERHPAVAAVDAQLAQVQEELTREIEASIGSLRTQYETLQEAERGYLESIGRIQEDARLLAQHEMGYRRLTREEEVNRKLFDTVFNRLKETGLSSEIRTNNVRMLDKALTPRRPVEPNKPRNMLLSLLIGLLGGVGLALLVDYLDSSIKVPEDVKSFGLPFLGIIPAIKPGQHGKDSRSTDLFILRKPRSTAAECFRTIRTNLTFMSPEQGLNRLIICSSGPQEGKSFVAINTALTLAAGGKKVVLLDSDMRRPRLHKVLGLERHLGISNVIVGDYRLDQVIQNTLQPGLDFIASGPLPPNPAELLHTQRFSSMLDQLSSQYDIVLLDSPPVLVVTDALILGNLVDGAVFVTRSNHTRREMAAKAIQSLQDVGARILGVVLNEFDTADKSYGLYHYQYQSYGQYYIEDEDQPELTESEEERALPSV